MSLQTYLPNLAFADCVDDIWSSNHLVTNQVVIVDISNATTALAEKTRLVPNSF